MNAINNDQKIYSVLDINTAIATLIKRQFTSYIWVCGEIQGLRDARDKAHSYFELVQKHPEKEEVIAKAKTIIFANRKGLIERRLKEAQGAFELKNDIEVKFLCEVSFYPPLGQYSLIVIDVDPSYTLGKIAQNRLAIIKELEKAGLLEKNKVLALSHVPLNIGLITAFDSAAYHDFIHELKLSGYGFKIYANNCYMQGKNVETDVVNSLKLFNSSAIERLDAIVITRGGGSTSDLAWFDNKKIAQEIALSKSPIISALGHSIDLTIADIVAHTSVKTPTKAGQFLVERVRLYLEELNLLGKDISATGQDIFRQETNDLKAVLSKLDSFILRYFRVSQQALIKDRHDMANLVQLKLNRNKELIEIRYRDLNFLLTKFFSFNKQNIQHVADKVNIMNPRNILKRGYSITYKDGKALKNKADSKDGDVLKTILYDGWIESVVKG